MANTNSNQVNQRKVTGRKINAIFIDIKNLRKDLGNKFVREQRERVNGFIKLAQYAFDREDYKKAQLWAEEALDIIKTNPTGKEWKKPTRSEATA